MRIFLLLIALTCLCACAKNDSISDRKYGQQLVCHNDKTMAVSNADSFIHQDHGDSLGPCPETR